MFAKIAAFEFRYQLRQPVFTLVALVFFALSFSAMVFEEFSFGAGGAVNRNGPFPITVVITVWTIFYMLVTTAFAANVVVRDDQTGFGPLVRSTRISKAQYLFGRFTGAFAAVLLCFLAVPLGLIIGSLAPWLDPETMGPLRLGDYAYTYAVLAVPGLLLTSALFFSVATVTRSMMGAYLAAVAVLVAYLLGGTLLQRLGVQGARGHHRSLRDSRREPRHGVLDAGGAQHPHRAAVGAAAGQRALVLGLSAAFLAAAYALFRFDARGKPARLAEKALQRERARSRRAARRAVAAAELRPRGLLGRAAEAHPLRSRPGAQEPRLHRPADAGDLLRRAHAVEHGRDPRHADLSRDPGDDRRHPGHAQPVLLHPRHLLQRRAGLAGARPAHPRDHGQLGRAGLGLPRPQGHRARGGAGRGCRWRAC
jgi:hypothetical protein